MQLELFNVTDAPFVQQIEIRIERNNFVRNSAKVMISQSIAHFQQCAWKKFIDTYCKMVYR